MIDSTQCLETITDFDSFEQQLEPTSESTKLEGKHQLHEYRAAGKLNGSNALITGGEYVVTITCRKIASSTPINKSCSSGIGRSIAVLFAREGANLTIVYLSEEQKDAEETKKMVEKEGRECLLVAGNLMDNETCKSAVQQHMDKYDKIDILVNNAGAQEQCDDIEKIDLDIVERTFRSNILQMFAVTKYALKHMERGGS